MKFLLIASFAPSILDFRGDLIRALIVRGLEVHVAAPGLIAGDAVADELQEMGVVPHSLPLQRTGTSIGADLRLLLYLRRLMRTIRPDLILGYTVKPVIFGLLAARAARVPRRFALITGLGYAFSGDNGRRGLRHLLERLYRAALTGATTVFFQNPDDQLLFQQRGLLGPAPSTVLNGSGVCLATFAAAPITTGPVRFLMIGRLLGDKGVREYVRAAQRLLVTHPEVRFQLVGWIDENPDAISAEELDVWVANGYIDYLGRMDDVRPAIAASTVYVLPSYREGTPRTVLEAMAMGRPIITTNAPGCRETVVDGENGFLVAVKSVDSLVEAMQRFIGDPSLALRMGAQSRKIAEDKYDVNKINEVMLRKMGILEKNMENTEALSRLGAISR